MKKDDFTLPDGSKKMSPLDMNKIAILKAHTVITFKDKEKTDID